MSYSEGFSVHKLGSLCSKIGSGSTPRGGSEVYLSNGNFALIRSQNIRNDGFDKNGLVYLTQDQADKLANVAVESNDILLNITGDSVARCCQVDNSLLPARVNQHVAIIRPNPAKLDPRFLRYILISPRMQQALLNLASAGATRNALTKGMLESLEIPFPHIEKQRDIADILGCLDNKIELNRQMCKTLEDIASTLFKSWFIDFDPVKAKAAGRKPEGLSPEIADLFPDRFVESTHEILPLGWQLKPLEELTNISIGRTPPRKEAEWFSLSSTDNKWISIKDLGDATVFISKTSEFLTSDAVKKFRIPIIPPKTVVISFKLTVGRVAITSEEMLSNEAIAHCINPKIPVEFLYLFLKKYNFDLLGNTSSIGTAVNSKSIKSIKTLVPGIELINYIKPYFQDVFDKIHHIVKENYKLLEIRNLLIPKLISGSVKLKDIQDICKDV